jgi:hypothetical protein
LQPYTNEYYDELEQGSLRSARQVAPLVLQWLAPRHAVDVGRGRGAWLAAFHECGVKDICGVDGDYLDRATLAMPAECFAAHDLTQPLHLGRTFDLVICVEVAEHLPAACADEFVALLTRLGPAVLFSAAAPFQGGRHHLNEQWPAYWAERFAAWDFVPVDCLRRRLWANPEVDWWYAQNLFLYADQDCLRCHPALQREYEVAGPTALAVVHPRRYLEWVEWGMSQSQGNGEAGSNKPISEESHG